MTGFIVFLVHGVEQLSELALLVSGCVLVDDVVANSLVHLLDSELVSFQGNCLVTCFNSCEELLHCSAELALENLVLKGLGSDYLNALLCTFDIRHNIHLPLKNSTVILECAHLRGDSHILSYIEILYHSFAYFAIGFVNIF